MFDLLGRFFLDAPMRRAAATLFFVGVGFAATLPYQSLFLIDQLGMSSQTYAIAIFIGSVISVLTSIGLGTLSDRAMSGRPLILALSALGATGYGLVFLVPTIPVALIAFVLILPIAGAVFIQLFAIIRIEADRMDSVNGGALATIARAIFSSSWIAVPPLTALLVAASGSLRPIYLVAALASLVCVLLAAGFVGRQENADSNQAQPYSLVTGLRQILAPHILLRLLGVSLISAAHNLNAILYPLIVVGPAGGVQADVGIIAGSVALLEIPFILACGAALARFGAPLVLGIGAVLFGVYLLALGFAEAMWQIYALVPLCACGAAAILSVPFAYLQDSIADKPGLGNSLMSVMFFGASGISAASFAFGSATFDYSATAVLAALLVVLGIALLPLSALVRIERNRKSGSDKSVGSLQ